MTDHTPTTDDMRELFCTPMTESQGINEEFHWEMEGRFDRWLAEVERAAAEKALTDAAEDYERYLVEPELPMEDQPSPMARHYKSTADRLRKRAAAIGLTAEQEREKA